MQSPNEMNPGDEEEFSLEELSQDIEQEEPLINWRMIGTVMISMILIISLVLGLIGPALLQPEVQIIVPTATPMPNPFYIGFGF